VADKNLSTLRQSLENAHSALQEIAKGRSAGDFAGEFSNGDGARTRSMSTSALVTGGALDPEQSNRFEQYVRGSSDMMKAADVQMLNNPKGEIDSVYLTNMITQKATEGTTLGETASVLLGDDNYETVETYAAIDVTHKLLTRNVEKEQFANTIIDMVIKAVGNDYSFMSVNGDTTSSDPALSCWDGYLKQAQNGRVISAGGAGVSYDLFAAANDVFDDQKRRYLRKQLRFMGHSRLWANWDKTLTSRATTLGDSVLGGGNSANPLGIAPMILDEMPTNLAVPISTPEPATVIGTIHGPFQMLTGANAISLNINGAGATTHTLPVGNYLPSQFVNALNTLLIANSDPAIVKIDQTGRIYFETPTTGTGATIVIATAPTSTMLDVIGMVAGSYQGKVAASTNTVNKGTSLWLADPKNFWFGVLNSLRVYWQYVPRGNKWELTVFSEAIPHLRDTEAIVTVEDIKLNSYL